jgi:Acyclic terpene utilisation family protein AtuA
MNTVRIGAGAGYSGDRIEPAAELAERGDIQYLVFECLAERTIAIAQQSRMKDSTQGSDPFLAERMQAVLPICARKGIKIITNMGAANPLAGAAVISSVARRHGLGGLVIAAVTGDDVLPALLRGDYTLLETGESIASLEGRLVSANAYLGVEPMLEALGRRADIIITGRVSDPALFLAPLVHEFGWGLDHWHRLGQGTVVGHLLECAGQVSGGYFADLSRKRVPDLARLGFPLAEVGEDGVAVITKAPGSGGLINTATCKEQLLYEIQDPSTYLTPDVTADFTGVTLTEAGPDRVLVEGGAGRARPETLKVSVGCRFGFIGEGQISYAGPDAVERGRLALEIVAQRLELIKAAFAEIRYDLIGVDSVHGAKLSRADARPSEVRARVAARTGTLRDAVRIGNEVEALYTNGPAAGGGVTRSAREVVAMFSALVPRSLATPVVHYETT